MMVLFAVSFVCLFHLVCMVLYLLFIYSSLKICMQILKKMSGVGVAVRYASHTDCLEFPVLFRRGYAAPKTI